MRNSYDWYFNIIPSPVHGVGVFAKRDIKAGEEFNVDLSITKLNDSEDPRWNYSFPFSKEFVGIPAGFSMFLNHSEDPNMKVTDLNKEKKFHTLSTLRDIERGEELFIDYGYDTEVIAKRNIS